MTLWAAVGESHTIESRDAGIEAARTALNQLGRVSATLGIVIVSQDYSVQQAVSGVTTLLGNIPLVGFSTSGSLTREGMHKRSVVVALLAGSELQASAGWWSGFADDNANISNQAIQKMIQSLQPGDSGGVLLIAADGLKSNTGQLTAYLKSSLYNVSPQLEKPPLWVAGGFSGCDLRLGRTYQIGEQHSGSGGLAAALLTGNIRAGIGASHGWVPVGPYYRITRTNGPWIRSIDDVTPGELYGRLFGYEVRQWGFPPLNEIVRLYPIGIESDQPGVVTQDCPYIVRSPLRVEANGSMRMNTSIAMDSVVHLLVGGTLKCLDAARQASRQALAALRKDNENAQPVLALVLVDVGWQLLFETQPGSEIRAVRETLGEEIPIIGGYTYAQLAHPDPAQPPELLNQFMVVILLGE